MLIIGIDPGISGSICFFNDGKIIDVIEMPNMIEGKKNKKQVNGAQIYNEISKRVIGINAENIKEVKTLFRLSPKSITSTESKLTFPNVCFCFSN